MLRLLLSTTTPQIFVLSFDNSHATGKVCTFASRTDSISLTWSLGHCRKDGEQIECMWSLAYLKTTCTNITLQLRYFGDLVLEEYSVGYSKMR